jgi:hypothetical protein
MPINILLSLDTQDFKLPAATPKNMTGAQAKFFCRHSMKELFYNSNDERESKDKRNNYCNLVDCFICSSASHVNFATATKACAQRGASCLY